jgi:IS605 OrfB family transposase
LATFENCIVIPLLFGKRECKFYDAGVTGEAELIHRKNQWFFNLVLDLPNVSVTGNSKIMGVDLGENNIAALSMGKLIGGGKLRFERDRFLALRRRLQPNGSKSNKQKLKEISGKEARHVKHVNHKVANQIISEAVKSDASVIAMENLTNIRQRIKAGKRVHARLHRRAWYQLQQSVEYKSTAVGIQVIFVNPAYSSKTCNACGQITKRNKHSHVCNCGDRATAT